jgi:hypothetical protein
MKKLSAEWTGIVNHSDRYVEPWLRTKNDAVARQAEEVAVRRVSFDSMAWVVSIGLALTTVALVIGGLGMFVKWATVPRCFIATGLGIGLSCVFVPNVYDVHMDSRTEKLREAKRAELQAELDADPLYVRAKLVVAAVQNFSAHCHKYCVWCVAVDKGLMKVDEGLAERYYAFLAKVEGMLKDAVIDCTNRITMRQDHPELEAVSDDKALCDFIARSGQRVEAPPGAVVADSHLDFEGAEALLRMAGNPDGDDLAERIDEAVARAALPPASR